MFSYSGISGWPIAENRTYQDLGRSIHNIGEDLRKPVTVYFSHSKSKMISI